jgi:predicted acylesterase/phospholipase RssA
MAQHKIQHLIASGGSVWGFYTFGVIKAAIHGGFLGELKSVYGTSVGTLTCVFMCCMRLGLDYEKIEDYIVKRPWHQLLASATHSPIQLLDKRGIITRKFFDELLEPLLKSVDLSLDTTLAELFDRSQIETHYFTTELNRYELVDLSHKTHPEWKVVDAVYASCTIPVVFDALVRDGNCYVDGGFLLNYPVDKCANDWPDDLDSMLGISLAAGSPAGPPSGEGITETSGLLDMLSLFLGKVVHKNLFGVHNHSVIQNNIILRASHMTMEYLYDMSRSPEMRQSLIDEGVAAFAEQFSLLNIDGESESSASAAIEQCGGECSSECTVGAGSV